MEPEEWVEFEKGFRLYDQIKNPILNLSFTAPKRTTRQKVEELPVEEKYSYVPSWWRGEDANAKIAMNSMKTLPKG